jgi:tRNA A-37 threonylcarbamoyl transferase component Bud32
MPDEARMLAGRYRLRSVLGRGGMGQVWLADDEMLGRQVAVKEIRFPSDLPADERDVLRERTLREARLTARLSHPGIITVYDVVSHEDSPYIVMELITAPSLAAAIDMEGALPPRRVAQIGLRLLDALDVAHAAGIVHRDVKPSNVLLDGDRVILSDFGIATSSQDATLTRTGLVVGSPTYMSPERLRSEGIGPGGDMWSLGATLYAALEGHPPFRARNVMATITAVLVDDPQPPSVHGALRDAVVGLLAKRPDQRLDSNQVRTLLLRAADESLDAEAAGPQPWHRQGATATADPPTAEDVPVMAPALEDPSTQTSAVAATAVQAGAPHEETAADGGAAGAGGSGGAPDAENEAQDGEVPAAGGWHAHPAPRAPMTPAGRSPARPPPPPSPQPPAGRGSGTGRTPSARRPGQRLLVGLLAAAVLLTAIIAGIVLLLGTADTGGTSVQDDRAGGSRKGDDRQPEEPPTDPPEQTEPADTAPDVPAGYRLVRDPLDFTVAVPRGWQRRLDGATRVDYVSPDGSQFLRIDQVARAGDDAEQAWLDAEPSLADSLSDYQRISIEPVDYRSWEAADWEFTWAGDSGRVHVLNRGFITDPRGFAIYASGPDESWTTETLPVFEVAADTFEPST